MADFDALFDTLKNGIKELAGDAWAELTDQVEEDSQAYLDKLKTDLARWTKLLAAGDLTADDLKYLVEGKKDLAEMTALKEAGLAAVKVDKLKRDLTNLVIDTTIDFVL